MPTRNVVKELVKDFNCLECGCYETVTKEIGEQLEYSFDTPEEKEFCYG